MPILEKKHIPVPSQRRSGQPLGKVLFGVAHDTGNLGSTAKGNIDYFTRSKDEIQASAHIFVDDEHIYECIPTGLTDLPAEKAWHVRYISDIDNKMFLADANDNSIGIEFCYGGGIDNQKSYENYVWIWSQVCKKYELNPLLDIAPHSKLDPTRRTDPGTGLAYVGKTFQQFIQDVRNAMEPKTFFLIREFYYGATDKTANGQVSILQNFLNHIGYSVGTVDGIYGLKTQAAVKAFQRRYVLYAWETATGNAVGPRTIKAVNSFPFS